ncbi:MAG TPA: hypothetical protein VLB80_00455 [Candidatus Babeliales bacterium]|nr:hypothetical protein [Candidatus Babeliales bacterium]
MLYVLFLRDCVEILLYTTFLYIFCKWLQVDRTKNLIIYFFAYCIFAIGAWIIQLPTISPFLFTYAPVALLLFIILHEKILQRNLIALCPIVPVRADHDDWLDILISSSLTVINTQKAITIIIENKDSLDYFLTIPFYINANISKHLLDILLISTYYNEQKMIWVDTQGKIRGINAVWSYETPFHTLQNDAIIISAHPISRTFTFIVSGKETKNISAHHVRMLIKKQLSYRASPSHKGIYREHDSPEKTFPH